MVGTASVVFPRRQPHAPAARPSRTPGSPLIFPRGDPGTPHVAGPDSQDVLDSTAVTPHASLGPQSH